MIKWKLHLQKCSILFANKDILLTFAANYWKTKENEQFVFRYSAMQPLHFPAWRQKGE